MTRHAGFLALLLCSGCALTQNWGSFRPPPPGLDGGPDAGPCGVCDPANADSCPNPATERCIAGLDGCGECAPLTDRAEGETCDTAAGVACMSDLECDAGLQLCVRRCATDTDCTNPTFGMCRDRNLDGSMECSGASCDPINDALCSDDNPCRVVGVDAARNAVVSCTPGQAGQTGAPCTTSAECPLLHFCLPLALPNDTPFFTCTRLCYVGETCASDGLPCADALPGQIALAGRAVGLCSQCSNDGECGAERPYCVGGFCTAPCSTPMECLGGLQCVNNRCALGESDCADTIDNDADGLTDCADTDCTTGSAACPSSEGQPCATDAECTVGSAEPICAFSPTPRCEVAGAPPTCRCFCMLDTDCRNPSFPSCVGGACR